MTIKTAISLPMLVLTTVATISVLISNIVQFSGYIDTSMGERLDIAAEVALQKINLYQSYSQTISLLLGEDPRIVEALENGNREALLEHIMYFYDKTVHNKTNTYFCSITDAAGKVIVRADEPQLYGDSVADLPQIALMLQGGVFSAIEDLSRIRMSVSSGSPIRDSQGRIVGLVINGFRLDTNEFVDSIYTPFNFEVSVFRGDEQISTTIRGQDGIRAEGIKAPPEVAEMVLSGDTFSGRKTILEREVTAKYVPLLNHAGAAGGMLFVGCYQDHERAIIQSFIYAGLIFTFLLLMISVPVINAIAKNIAVPINEASTVLSSFSEGNFDIRIKGKYKGDMAVLQNSINETGIKLSAYLKEKIRDDKIKELAALVSIADAGIIVLEKNGHVRDWNIGAENILGYMPDEITGKTLKDYSQDESSAVIDRIQGQLKKGEHIAHVEITLQHKNGHPVYCSASFTPLYDEKEQFYGSVSIFQDITGKMVIEQTAREMAAILTNAAAGVVVMDKAGVIRVWNRGAQDILGYQPEEIIGHTTHYMTAENYYAEVDDVAERIAKGEHIAHTRVLRKHKDGRLIECSVSWTPIYDNRGYFNGSAAIFHDITTEVLASNKAKNLAAIISTADAGIIISNADFNVIDWNVGAEKILGYTFEEVAGIDISFYAYADRYDEIQQMKADLRSGKHIMHTEVVRRHKDGRRVDCSASFTPVFDDRGAFTGSVSVFHDISEKKNIEQALEEAVKMAEEASRAKSMFLANMSHEIRTPLNGVIGFAELALDENGISVQVEEYLNKIKHSADGLLDIINDILDISKIESGKMELEKIPFNLQDVLSTCQSIIEPKAMERGIVLQFYSEAAGGRKLLGDPTRLRQTLLNLLSNAVKFTNHGMVKVTAMVEDESDDSLVIRFEVRDTGIGMTEDQLRNIFDAFIQADTTTTRKYGGTGLGLALTRKFVEMMGGMLEAESMPGLGSKFSFTLTFAFVPGLDAVPEKQMVASVVGKPVFSGEVLVCEDNYMNQELITNHLERIGLTATIAGNGKQGVICAEKRMKKGNPFDLILMDINMPVMDGLEATRKLIEAGNTAPIIALTANAISTDKEQYLQHGMSDYLGKPFTSQELWACLLRHLKPVNVNPIPVSEQRPVSAAADNNLLIINDVLNEEVGIQRTSDDEHLYRHIQKNFVKDYEHITETLNALINSGKIDNAYRKVHTLKSTARTIGAEKTADAASEIEISLFNKDTSRLTEQLAALENALQNLFKILPFAVEGEPDPVSEKNAAAGDDGADDDIDTGEAAALIDTLAPLLEAGYTESLNYIDKIKTVFAALGKERDELIAQIEDYEFDAAYVILCGIKESLG